MKTILDRDSPKSRSRRSDPSQGRAAGKSRGWMVGGERQAGSGIFPGSVAHLPTEPEPGPGPGRGLSLWVSTRRHRHARAQRCSGPSVSQLVREDAWFAHKRHRCALLPTLQRGTGLLNTPVPVQLWMERHHSLQERAKRCQLLTSKMEEKRQRSGGTPPPPSPVREQKLEPGLHHRPAPWSAPVHLLSTLPS